MAAMMPMIATTIRSSMRVNPSSRTDFFMTTSPQELVLEERSLNWSYCARLSSVRKTDEKCQSRQWKFGGLVWIGCEAVRITADRYLAKAYCARSSGGWRGSPGGPPP